MGSRHPSGDLLVCVLYRQRPGVHSSTLVHGLLATLGFEPYPCLFVITLLAARDEV